MAWGRPSSGPSHAAREVLAHRGAWRSGRAKKALVDGRVLTIAGSDSGGGAGLQADVKTVTAFGGFAATAITAVTVQNTLGVSEVALLDPLLVESQVEAVLDDIGADAIKTGMLGNRTIVELVVRQLERRAQSVPIVVDPVIVSSSGRRLLDAGGLDVLSRRLLPICALVTPNLDEAAELTGITVDDEGAMHQAADRLLLMGVPAVLVTGGHLAGETVVDLLRTADGLERRFEAERIDTTCTHGTGCTLSAGIAACLAQGMTLESSVERAIAFVRRAMDGTPHLGRGRAAPLDHGHVFRTRPAGTQVH